MLGRLGRANAGSSSAVPRQQTSQVIAIGTVGAESLLVEKTLDPTTEANLVGVFLGSDWPTHPVVPATTKNHHSGTG